MFTTLDLQSAWALPRPEEREWAFQVEDVPSGWVRNLQFDTMKMVEEALELFRPVGVYQSVGFYEHPTARKVKDMVQTGAHIFADVDDSMLKTESWRLDSTDPNGRSVDNAGLIAGLNMCFKPSHIETFTDTEKSRLLGTPALHALGVTWAMRTIFGARDIKQTFSGNRGFHVYVLDEEFTGITTPMRREIVDFLTDGHATRELLDGAYELRHEGGLGLQIDRPVSIDVRRISRTPGSIHGKSGMRCCPVNEETLIEFVRAAVAPIEA